MGDFRSGVDGKFRGFLWDPATGEYTTIEGPDAESTTALDISPTGRVLVRAFATGGARYYFWEAGTFTEIVISDLADLADVDLVAFTDSGLFAGNAGEAGFVFDGETVQVIEVPGATLTNLFGLREDGTVYGSFIDANGEHHGFIAIPDGQRLVPRRSARMHAPFQQSDCWPGSKHRLCRGR